MKSMLESGRTPALVKDLPASQRNLLDPLHSHRAVLDHPEHLLILHVGRPADTNVGAACREVHSRVSPVQAHFGVDDTSVLPVFHLAILDSLEQDLESASPGTISLTNTLKRTWGAGMIWRVVVGASCSGVRSLRISGLLGRQTSANL